MKRNSISLVVSLIAAFFVPTAPAFAVSSIVVDKPNGYVTAGQTVDLPMEISGVTWATINVLITANSGSITVADPGSTLTLGTGYLSLTGSDLSFSGSASDVIAALESGVSWTSPSSPASSSARFKITLTEPVAGQVINPSNGHTYKFVASGLGWMAAQSAAELLTVEGNPGYLATVTSASENSFVASKTGASDIWIGGTSNESFLQNLNPALPRSRNTCKFYWGVGPEAGTAISTGCGNPAASNSIFNNYASGEPNNAGGEDCIVTNWSGVSGKWNDLPCTRSNAYLVEFDTTTADFAESGLVYDNSEGTATDTDLSGGGGGGGLALPNAPAKPTVVRDEAGIATISWEAPVGGGAVASYIVTASPGGDQCTVTAPALSCTIDTRGGPRTFAVSAVNATGESSASEPSDLLDGFYVEASSEDNVVVGIEQNDALDVVTHAPIDYAGEATQTITTTWSNQSLSIDNVNDVTYPEGWGLEYTTDGMTWSGTAPGSLSTVAGVRASGDVNLLESGLFTSTADAQSIDQTESFAGGVGGGDGFNVGFGNGILVNSYHHQGTRLSCHYLDGTVCGPDTSFAGYGSSANSSVFIDKTNNHLYQFVRRYSDSDYGVLCVDFTDETSPVTCTTPFLTLSEGTGGTSDEALGAPYRDGTRLWSSESAHNVLMCFDMATQAACGDGDNGFAIGGTPNGGDAGKLNLRLAARDGIVFFTTVNDKMGCYDSSTHALCGGNAPIAIPSLLDNRSTPVLIEDTAGTFTGACDVYTRSCLTRSGTAMTVPSGLNSFWNSSTTSVNLYIAGQNMLDYTITKHRLYWGGPQQPGGWSHNITCFDFSTNAACAGFTILPAGNGNMTSVYTASADPDNPKCVWVVQHDQAKIFPINYKTGAIGCSSATALEAFVPIGTDIARLGCDADTEVLAWESLTLTLPAGLTAADVTININDTDDVALADWQDVTLGEGGVIDLSALDVADSGTNPIVHIIEDEGGPSVDLSDTTASILFSAGAPEVCVALTAVTRCPDMSPNPSSPNVPDGIIKGESIIEPSNEDEDVSDDETITLAGTNTEDVCAASLPGNPPDPPTNVTVTPGNGTATVGWTPATGGTGGAATSYTVTDESGLHSCTVNAPATSCEITGLTNGYPYVFHVVGNNPSGGSEDSPKTPAMIPTAPYSGNTLTIYFTSISPKLNAYNQSLIDDFIDDHSFKSVKCTGSTQGLETIVWLAKSRAVNACNYAKTVKSVKTSAVISKNKGIRPPLRSVVLVGK